MKKQITNIRILWTENNSTQNRDYDHLDRVNSDLRFWAKKAPEPGGGYDKTKFLVTWEDGAEWEGRIDLQRPHAEELNIVGKHIAEQCKFSLGLARPGHMTPEKYAQVLAQITTPTLATMFQSYLDNYDLGEA